MLNLWCFGKKRKKKRKRGTGIAGGQNGLQPVLSPQSQQRKSVAIEKVCHDREILSRQRMFIAIEFLGPASR